MRPSLRVANVFEDQIDTRDAMQMHWKAIPLNGSGSTRVTSS